MNRQEKETVVVGLKHDFSHSAGLFLICYRGMTVGQLQRLRASLRKNYGQLKVAKVRLVRRAMEDIPGSNSLMPFLREQIALVLVEKEPPIVAKTIYDFSREVSTLQLVAGFLDEHLVPAEVVIRIALLPPRDVLLAQVCGTIKAPISRCAIALSSLQRKLVTVAKQIELKKN